MLDKDNNHVLLEAKPGEFANILADLSVLKARIQSLNVKSASVLVVDDNAMSRELLSKVMERLGHDATLAEDGDSALEIARSRKFDLVLLDVILPKVSGYRVLECLKSDPALRNIPVIIISGVEDLESIASCIEIGAEDYLVKPFNFTLLKARISASLEKKRLRELQEAYLKELEIEQKLSDHLLSNVLPRTVADRLKKGEKSIADRFSDVTVLFADIADFTSLSAALHPHTVVSLLNEIFTIFDSLAEQHGVEKIKTIGDGYMAVGGLSEAGTGHTEAVAEMALSMQNEIARFKDINGDPVQIRIGIHWGPIVAGVVGTKKFAYDVWGDTVNTAGRMESTGIPGLIHVTETVCERLKDKYLFKKRGIVDVKGKGSMVTYFLTGRKTDNS